MSSGRWNEYSGGILKLIARALLWRWMIQCASNLPLNVIPYSGQASSSLLLSKAKVLNVNESQDHV